MGYGWGSSATENFNRIAARNRHEAGLKRLDAKKEHIAKKMKGRKEAMETAHEIIKKHPNIKHK